jgi:hypothetical protein
MSLNEAIVEDAALECFRDLGYAVGHGPTLAPGEPAAERESLLGQSRKVRQAQGSAHHQKQHHAQATAIKQHTYHLSLVPEEGLEPTRCCHHWILSPARLPFRHSGLGRDY